ncbi:MAG TPA: hypothetical protein PLR06_10345 [Cyclobacteriaceae bacterium]|nr:hypothetical protein [Cyclobacteriaceae bacterium]
MTFLSIVGSAVSLLWSWNSDRALRIHENADKIRIEAANVLGKLNRTQDIYMSFYDEIQPDVVDASEILSQTHNTVNARDLMWKRLQLKNGEVQRRILNEQVEVAFVGLMPFDNKIDSLYNLVMLRLKNLQVNQFRLLLGEIESAVLESKTTQEGETAILGNTLRGIIASYRDNQKELMIKGAAPLEQHLKELIQSPDKLLLDY